MKKKKSIFFGRFETFLFMLRKCLSRKGPKWLWMAKQFSFLFLLEFSLKEKEKRKQIPTTNYLLFTSIVIRDGKSSTQQIVAQVAD